MGVCMNERHDGRSSGTSVVGSDEQHTTQKESKHGRSPLMEQKSSSTETNNGQVAEGCQLIGVWQGSSTGKTFSETGGFYLPRRRCAGRMPKYALRPFVLDWV